jgi:ABC-type transporter Mla subunit MlaD
VQEIAAASGEQADGVAQITGAMNHLSGSTQQTAGASEELSATAEELSHQAEQLQQLVAGFQLAEDPAAGRLNSPRTGHPAKAPVVRQARKAQGPSHRVAAAGPASAVGTGDVDESQFTSF